MSTVTSHELVTLLTTIQDSDRFCFGGWSLAQETASKAAPLEQWDLFQLGVGPRPTLTKAKHTAGDDDIDDSDSDSDSDNDNDNDCEELIGVALWGLRSLKQSLTVLIPKKFTVLKALVHRLCLFRVLLADLLANCKISTVQELIRKLTTAGGYTFAIVLLFGLRMTRTATPQRECLRHLLLRKCAERATSYCRQHLQAWISARDMNGEICSTELQLHRRCFLLQKKCLQVLREEYTTVYGRTFIDDKIHQRAGWVLKLEQMVNDRNIEHNHQLLKSCPHLLHRHPPRAHQI